MKVYNLKIIPGFFCILAVLAAAVFAACENPWMKEAVAPLYKNKEGDNGPAPVPTLHSIAEAAAYLAVTPAPVPLTVALDLSGAEWWDLLGVIADAGKTVQLNLSACTPSGSAGGLFNSGPDVIFNPDALTPTGKSLITSLVLPNAATKIAPGFYLSEPTFQYFSALAGVAGANVKVIDQNAFSNCDALKSVNLPRVTDIGLNAFYDCDGLITIDIPAETIGNYAFADCDALTAVNLSEATSIGDSAFYGCTSLAAVSLSSVLSIGNNAFYGCTSLAAVSLSSVLSIGNNAFRQCSSLESVSLPATPPALGTNVFQNTGPSGTLTIHVPSGTVGNYTGTWGVANNPSVSPNDDAVYGANHKDIYIMGDLP